MNKNKIMCHILILLLSLVLVTACTDDEPEPSYSLDVPYHPPIWVYEYREPVVFDFDNTVAVIHEALGRTEKEAEATAETIRSARIQGAVNAELLEERFEETLRVGMGVLTIVHMKIETEDGGLYRLRFGGGWEFRRFGSGWEYMEQSEDGMFRMVDAIFDMETNEIIWENWH